MGATNRAAEIEEAAASGAFADEDAAAATLTRHTVGCMCPQCDLARAAFAAGRQSVDVEVPA